MRQTWKDRRRQLSSGTALPMPRMLTLVLMLAIMALIFTKLRDPNTWRFFAQDNDDDIPVVVQSPNVAGSGKAPAASSAKANSGKEASTAPTKPLAADSGKAVVAAPEKAPAADSGKVPAAGPPPPAPVVVPAGPVAVAPATEGTPPAKNPSTAAAELTPTGPTDLDQSEQDDIKPAVSIITDGAVEMSNLDMPAYYRILTWVDHQSTALLRKRAKKDVRYSDFRKTPESMRLQLVELKLNVRQIVALTNPPKNGIDQPMTTDDGHPLYEVRGFTQEGGSNLYFGIVTDLPAGMPLGTSVNEDAKLVGYFFKLQGYISLQQQLEAERTRKKPTPLKAPVIIGRLIWTVSPAAAEVKTPFWVLATIGSVAMLLVVGGVLFGMLMSGRRRLPAIVPGPSPDPEAPSVDNWLDQAQSGRLTLLPVPESSARYDGASLDNAAPDRSFGNRFSGNIFGGNGESNNGHGGSGPEVRDNGNPSSG